MLAEVVKATSVCRAAVSIERRSLTMPVRTFDEDAQLATDAAVPVPRGIALQVAVDGGAPPSEEAVTVLVRPALSGDWQVRAVPSLPGWYRLTPPADTAPIPLGTFWETVRALQ